MREWAIAKVDMLCGLCGAHIGRGEAMQLVPLPLVKRKRVRCEKCADGRAPDQVNELQRTHLEAAEMVARVAALKPELRDGKALAVADA